MPRAVLPPARATTAKADRKRKSLITPQQRQQIVALYASRAKTAAELALQFDVTPSAIYHYFHRAGIKPHRQSAPHPSLAEPEVADLAHAYAIGTKTVAELAFQFGVDAHTIYNYLRRAGVTPRRAPSRSHPALTETQIVELAHAYATSTMTIAELATHFDITSHTIYASLRHSGVTLRRAARRQALSETQIAGLARAYAKGDATAADLARRYGLTVATIYNYLRNAGVVLRRRRKSAIP